MRHEANNFKISVSRGDGCTFVHLLVFSVRHICNDIFWLLKYFNLKNKLNSWLFRIVIILTVVEQKNNWILQCLNECAPWRGYCYSASLDTLNPDCCKVKS